jgi:uncharacterized protein (DUF1697 family)
VNCIALIRGINVGKTKRLSMSDLRDLFSNLGYTNVRTLLNSGNVVFAAPKPSTPKLAVAIEKAIAAKFEFDVRVVVITAPALNKIIDENPLLDVAADFSRHFIAFGPDSAAWVPLRVLQQQSWAPDVLAMTSRAAYLWCEAGAIDSKLSLAFGRNAGGRITLRNWATVLKIQALAAAGQ